MESVVDTLLKNETDNRFDRSVRAELPPGLKEQFLDQLAWAVEMGSARVPSQNPTRLVEVEGSVGVLPGPAKAIIAKELLQGQTVSQLRISQQEFVDRPNQKQIDMVTLHLICEVKATTAINTLDQQLFIAAIQCLQAASAQKNVTLRPGLPQDPPLNIRGFQSLIHLVKKGAFGQYSLNTLSLANHEDAKKVLQKYRQTLDETAMFDPDTVPDKANVAEEILFSQIADSFNANNQGNNLSVAILTPYEHGAYSRLVSHPSYLSSDSQPFIGLSSKSPPQLFQYDQEQHYVMHVD